MESLLALMDPSKRGPLLAISSEDHYVRLYSDRGDSLIAMRFSNAVAALTVEDGMQVHRSWWVAADAVEAVNRAGEGLQLKLCNGLKVPVSRSYALQVRKRWADRLT
jgi:DNA-binding LytR/AlgR family response regulator